MDNISCDWLKKMNDDFDGFSISLSIILGKNDNKNGLSFVIIEKSVNFVAFFKKKQDCSLTKMLKI